MTSAASIPLFPLSPSLANTSSSSLLGPPSPWLSPLAFLCLFGPLHTFLSSGGISFFDSLFPLFFVRVLKLFYYIYFFYIHPPHPLIVFFSLPFTPSPLLRPLLSAEAVNGSELHSRSRSSSTRATSGRKGKVTGTKTERGRGGKGRLK